VDTTHMAATMAAIRLRRPFGTFICGSSRGWRLQHPAGL